MKRFKAFWGDDEDLPEWVGEVFAKYQVLCDMYKKEVICDLTEPEDKSFFRDLLPLVEFLNRELSKEEAKE